MRYFDLHCDTITECCVRGQPLKKNSLHVDLCRAASYSQYTQCFAAWIPDELCGAAATQRFYTIANLLKKEVCTNASLISSGVDKEKYTPCKALLTIENGSALGGNLENIPRFKKMGVAMMTLTWNGENELGSGVRSTVPYGLTPFGKSAVALLEEEGILVDISHASSSLFWDVVCMSTKPLVASHSNARKLCSNLRNLSDEQFFALRDMGGLVGLNFYSGFLRNDAENASMDDIVGHADYFLSLGGKDCLSMGSDFDGAALPGDMQGIESVQALYNRFLQKNYSEELLDKIFYKNAFRFFQRHDLL